MSFTIMVSANEADLKSILTTNEWQLDVSETLLLNDSSLKENKIKFDEIFSKLFDLKFSFDSNNGLTIKLLDVPLYKGKYVINKNQLVFVNNLKEDKQTYKVISFHPDQIIMKEEENNLYFVLSTLKTKTDFKSILLLKNWKLDIESMKLGLMLKMTTMPQMKDLSRQEKEIHVKSTLMALEGIRYHFKDDYSLDYKILHNGEINYEIKGTFFIDQAKRQLITNTVDDPNKTFQIIEVGENKIVLKSLSNNLDFIFIPDNK